MSAVMVSHARDHDRALTRSTWRAVGVLGLREGRRMLLSPVIYLLAGFFLVVAGVGAVADLRLELPSARATYDVIVFITALYLGLLVYAAAHLVTSSARRTGAEPQLAAGTLTARQRRGGLCLGVVFGPGGLGLVLMGAAALLGNNLVASNPDGWGPDEPPMSLLFLAQLILVLVGGGLFGVMWATWLRFPGSLPLGFVALVFLTVWLLRDGGEPLHTWQWFAPYISAPTWFDDAWTSAGSHGWHTVYLVGLCAMAWCGTMLRDREHRSRWIAISAVVVLATGAAGAVQVA